MLHLMNACLNDARKPQKCGFTLVEVLVALAVLSVGAVASGYYYSAFASMRKRERETVGAVVAASEYIENAIENKTECADTNYVVKVNGSVSLSITCRMLPGVAKLEYMNVAPFVGEPVQRELPVAFRRVVYCK